MLERIKKVVESEIKPALDVGGGDVEVLGIEDGIVRLRISGVCTTCSMIYETLTNSIESRIREKVPEVKGVVFVC
ncbi:MAG: NifU family protein [Candidatus Syntropharchaeia archaeon]